MKQRILSIIEFFKNDLWRLSLDEIPFYKAILVRQLRVVSLAFRGYKEDKVQEKASALTFYSLLSVVPVAAMAFGIAKGFGFDNKFEQVLVTRFSGQEEVMNWIIQFSRSFLENTKAGLIAGIGVVILFWSVMKVLGNIENSFNDIWEVKKSRAFVRKFSDYLSMMLIAPVLLFLSSGITVFIETQLEQIAASYEVIGMISPVLFFLIKLIPYVLVWLLFTLVYIIMPNTKVQFKSALVAGIIAGFIFQIIQWGYLYFQIGVSQYGAVYGSFAAFPLFLIWLQISWLIVLFGAEISFASQNIHRYEYESDTVNISNSYKRTLTLLICQYIVKNFSIGDSAYTSTQISKQLQIPIRLVRQILYELEESRILVETVSENSKEQACQPAIDINKLTIQYVLNAIDRRGSENIKVLQTSELESINKILTAFDAQIKQLDDNILLKDI